MRTKLLMVLALALIGFAPLHADTPVLAQADQLLYLPSLMVLAGDHLAVTSLNPTSPASLQNQQPVTVTFTYYTIQSGGVRIWAIPYTQGNLSPGYAYSGSNVEPAGGGVLSRQITIFSGSTLVDAIRVTMKTADGLTVLTEIDVPVAYSFAP